MAQFSKNKPGCKCCERDCGECLTQDTPDCNISFGGDASIFYLDVSGLSNDTCTSCTDWNGTDIELCWDQTTATWKGPLSASTDCSHSAGDPLWEMSVAWKSGTTYTYTLTMLGVGAEWKLDVTDRVKCRLDKTLTLSSPAPTGCSNYPATLTVRSCLLDCSYCSGDTPDSIKVQLQNIGDRACSCAADIQGEYVLDSVGTCEYHLRTLGPDCAAGFASILDISAVIQTQGWFVTYTLRQAGQIPGQYYYRWDGGSTPFDCTTARTLPNTLEGDRYFCTNGSSSVILTPL